MMKYLEWHFKKS